MANVRKFEAALAEPLYAEYQGDRFRLKGEMPALPILRGVKARLGGELDREASSGMIIEVLEAGFEDGELDRLLKTGVSMATLTGILVWAMAVWAGEEPPSEGEAEPPATGDSQESSSNGSTSSKPTSSESTVSTSGGLSALVSTGGGS